MMDGAAIKELSDRLATPGQIGETGFIARPNTWVIDDPAALVKPGPTADALKAYSLGAVRDYLAANRDALELAKLVVHVVSPQIVRVLGPIQMRARNREMYVEATAQNLTDSFLGKWMAHDEFVIGLQTRFAVGGDMAAVLKLVGNLTAEQARTSVDDGMTQAVTVKSGIAFKADAVVPNPVSLVPFRTFREVLQPTSPFALRVHSTMQVGLFEADGGAWRLTAIEAIGVWLTQELVGLDVEVIA